MPIEVSPVTQDDFIHIRKLTRADGQLTTPAVDFAMPVRTDAAAQLRHEWSIDQQADIKANEPTARQVKAVDSARPSEILAIARWHCYTDGYAPSALEYAGCKPKDDPVSYPEGFNKEIYNVFLDKIFQGRKEWTGRGKMWFLTTLKTREPMRRQGAGSALIKWGLEQAKQDACPAYLEATPAADSLYRKLGLEAIGDIDVDLTDVGIDFKTTLRKMRANPYVETKLENRQ